MYYVKKRLEISASHQLHLSYESKCENLHGHNKTSTIYCRSIRQQRIWQGGFANRFHAATKSKCKNRKTTPPVMKKINEIFYSLQGEGFWSGTPIIFIRFSGCNLRCDFCDTEHYSHTEMSDAEIIDRIKTFPARRVCLTGGEPSLQIDRFFIDLLHSHGYIIHIETNGTHAIPDGIDWITVSPKTSRIALDRADELKIVFTGQDVDSWLHFDANHRYLQPCSCRNTPEVIQYILAHPEWSLSLQTHKYIDIP